MKSLFFPAVLCAGLGLSCSVPASDLAAPGALGADMLPRGQWAARLETRFSRAEERFDGDGDREALAAAYDGLTLNSTLLPLPPGASLGVTDIAARMHAQQARFTLGYGFSEDLTAGFQIGHGETRNRVNAAVSGGNVCPSPGACTQMTQNLLSTVYGYKPIASSTWSSILDPLIGLRWRFDQGEDHATVFAPTLRLGLAREADPADLMQMILADSTTDLLLGVLHTRKLGEHWDLLLSAQYTIQFPDHLTARARSANELLVPASRTERLRRDRTDPLELTADLGYGTGPWRFSGRLEYARGGRDKFTSPSGQDTSGLSAGTDFHFLLGYLGVAWNGIPGYLRGENAWPLIVSLSANTTLKGKNTAAPDSVYLTFTLPF